MNQSPNSNNLDVARTYSSSDFSSHIIMGGDKYLAAIVSTEFPKYQEMVAAFRRRAPVTPILLWNEKPKQVEHNFEADLSFNLGNGDVTPLVAQIDSIASNPSIMLATPRYETWLAQELNRERGLGLRVNVASGHTTERMKSFIRKATDPHFIVDGMFSHYRANARPISVFNYLLLKGAKPENIAVYTGNPQREAKCAEKGARVILSTLEGINPELLEFVHQVAQKKH